MTQRSKVIRAAVLTGERQIEIQEFPRPRLGLDDGLLRVEASGICGTDVEQYHGAAKALGQPDAAVLGHEPVGIIEEVGEIAARRWGVQPGDRVAVEPFFPCGQCETCRAGRYSACSGPVPKVYSFVGTDVAPGLWGGHADYLYLHPNTILHKLSPDLPADLAALFNPLGAGVAWAVQAPGTSLGDTVVVLGAGQRGLCCVVALRAAGAGTVIVTDVASAEDKLRLARDFGASHTITADRDDVTERIRALTRGRLADLVVDVSAYATQPVVDALDMVRPGGTVVLAGLKGGREIPGFVSDKIVQRQITVRGVWGVQGPAYRQAIRIIESGRFPLERLRTHSFGLDDAETAIRTLAREVPGSESAINVVIRP